MSTEKPDASSLWDRLLASVERLATLGQQKTDAAALARKLAARAKQLSSRATADAVGEASLVYLAFRRGRERFGMPIGELLEIQALDHITPVPRMPSFLLGVVHWRGAILSLFDLPKLFNIPVPGIADSHFCLIVQAAGRRVAVVATEIEDLFAATTKQLQPAPARERNFPHDWIIGVHDENRLIVCMERILTESSLQIVTT